MRVALLQLAVKFSCLNVEPWRQRYCTSAGNKRAVSLRHLPQQNMKTLFLEVPKIKQQIHVYVKRTGPEKFVKSCSVSVYYGYTIYGSYLETNELVDVSDWKKNARSKNKEYQHKSALGERHYSFGGNFQIGDNVPSASRFQNIPSKI